MRYDIALEDLNLGLEIEGAFSDDLVTRLQDKVGDFCGDSSVNGSLSADLKSKYKKKSSSGIREFKTKIICADKVEDIFNNFQKPDFICDDTCGLHLHVSIDDLDYKALWGVVSDWNFLKKVKKMAIDNFGDKQADRLQGDHIGRYARDYLDRRDLIMSSTQDRGDKYKFVRFHNELKTLEWRFFALYDKPQQNIDNINMFLQALLEQINSDKIYTQKSEVMFEDNIICEDYVINLGKLDNEKEYNQIVTLKEI